jgi:hypothetical protein
MSRSAALLALALTASVSTVAQARGTKTITHNKIVGDSVYAIFEYSVGPVNTYLSVSVTNQTEQDGGPRTQDAFLSITMSQYNTETFELLAVGEAFTPDFVLTMDKGLNTATVRADHIIFQNYGVFPNVFTDWAVNLTFTGSGVVDSQHSHFNEKDPGVKLNIQFEGDFRDAIASGSIFGGGVQFTPVPSTSAQLQHNKFGIQSAIITTP